MDIIDLKTIAIIVLIFVPLERLFALNREQKVFRKGWINDLVYLFLNGLVIKLGLMVIITVVMIAITLAAPTSLHAWVQAQPLWLQLIEIVVIADVGFYLAHRAFHSVPILWRFHAIHHSIEELDWLAAHRVHPVDQVLTKAASLLPVFALGYSGLAIAIFAVVFQWHALFIHANTRISLGPLKWLVASPDFHHWHHAKERSAYNKNFAGQLPFLDMLGGTFHLPKQRFPEKYGIDEVLPDLYLHQVVHPFRRPGEEVGAPNDHT